MSDIVVLNGDKEVQKLFAPMEYILDKKIFLKV